MDPQRPEHAVNGVREFLRRAGGAEPARFAPALDALRTPRAAPAPPLPVSVREDIAELNELVHRSHVGLTEDDYARVVRQIHQLERSAELATAPFDRSGPQSYYAVRDRLMADAVADAVASAGDAPGLAVALWAHNGHLSCGLPSSGLAPMGSHLRERFGTSYYALALLQGGGTFHARRKRLVGGLTEGPVPFRLSPASDRTVEGTLSAAVDGDHLIDLRDAAAPAAAARWREGIGWTRSYGAVASMMYRFAFTPVAPGAEFDGLGYVHRGGPPTPCPLD